MKILATFLNLSTALFSAQEWLEGTQIPEGPGGDVKQDVSLVYNTNEGRMFAAWADTSNHAFASIYDGNWTTSAIPMGSSTAVTDNVFLGYDSAAFKVFAAWGNAGSAAYFSIYSSGSWSAASTIPLGVSAGVFRNINLSYFTSNSKMIAAWTDNIATAHFPIFSSYSGGSWTPGALISMGGSSGVSNDVNLAYDSLANRIVAAWGDLSTNAPYASRYDGSTWTTTAIPIGSSSGALKNVTLAFDPVGNQMFAAWVDVMNRQLYFSIYSSGAWSTADLLPSGMSVGGLSDVYLAYDTIDSSMFAAWANFGSQGTFYNIYTAGAWGAAGQINPGNSLGAANDVILAYHTGVNEMFSAWKAFNGAQPYWSPYAFVAPPSNSRPPNYLRPYNHRPKNLNGPG